MKRSKVALLPNAVKAWLDQALIQGNFSGYEILEKELADRGCTIGKSSLHRYGQQFEKRLQALNLASQQAKAIVQSAPDEEGAVSEALMRLVQEKLFQSLMDMQLDPDKPVDLAKVSKAVAELARATVTQKKWTAEVRAKVALASDAVLAIGQKGGLSADALEEIKRRFLGIA